MLYFPGNKGPYATRGRIKEIFLSLDWGLALFFGAIIVVTGPTVIGSLLKSLYLTRRLETLLHWESIWGDVLGVVLSALALGFIVPTHAKTLGGEGVDFLLRVIGGVSIGLISGVLLGRVLIPWSAKLKDRGLPGIISVAWALMTFTVANLFVEASGPVAAAVAGFSLSYSRVEALHEIRHFKEQLSSLFIGIIFVLLSASINPMDIVPFWPGMLAVAIILGAVVRPVSVLLALLGTSVPWQERLFVGLIGPRGIIALAMVSYASFFLEGSNTGITVLMNLTFSIIFLSGLVATLGSLPLAKLLKVLVKDTKMGLLVVGMNPLSQAIAGFAAKHVPVAFADTSQNTCSLAESMGHETVCADVLDSDLYEDALEQGFGRLLVITKNDALNQLIAQAASVHMGPEKVFRAHALDSDDAIVMETTSAAMLAFSRKFSVPQAVEMLEKQKAALKVIDGREIKAEEGVIPLLEIMDDDNGIRIVTGEEVSRGKALCFVPEKT
ncbi:MAG: NAD-binding protein [Deltaproteobacteria bacterium]|nr:NAD-binding protein [Deltaproteobacteria bacterium]MBW1978351.1 NAD-binding protein [Deltaproteobacteria bacterium]MBW2046488.1 NAD-binding protein [Deltaproteobacteria bacterium]MBW2299732.1 NAD-binding protein [Deltaproteobacteria bacterium]RLB32122.1 MAG: hypothetical protein DRH11_12290 [Deltaproteobacteria bacterium]